MSLFVANTIAFLGTTVGAIIAGFVVGCVIGALCRWIADFWTRQRIKKERSA